MDGISVASREVAPQDREERARRKEVRRARHARHRSRESSAERRPTVESRAVDEAEMGHTPRVTHGERLRDAASDAVSDEACAVDAKLVEEGDSSFGVRADVDRMCQRPIAASEPEEIEDDEPVPAGHQRDDVAPKVTGRRKAVEEDDGHAGAARSCGVVVESRAAQIEKLTAHAKLRR